MGTPEQINRIATMLGNALEWSEYGIGYAYQTVSLDQTGLFAITLNQGHLTEEDKQHCYHVVSQMLTCWLSEYGFTMQWHTTEQQELQLVGVVFWDFYQYPKELPPTVKYRK